MANLPFVSPFTRPPPSLVQGSFHAPGLGRKSTVSTNETDSGTQLMIAAIAHN